MSTRQDWSWMTPGGFDQALNCATPEENTCLRQAAGILLGSEQAHARARQWAQNWLTDMRADPPAGLSVESLLQQYPMHTPAGLALMRMAEALTRTPDEYTRRLLLADKLAQGDWDKLRLQHSGMQAWLDRTLAWAHNTEQSWLDSQTQGLWGQIKDKGVQGAAAIALRRLGQQFIAGPDVNTALAALSKRRHACDSLSFDSLGEAARTQADVDGHLQAYLHSIAQLGPGCGHSVSVKLSALHPQFDELHRDNVMRSLPPRLLELAQAAASKGIALTIDAEEADRLMLTLDVAQSLHCLLAQHPQEEIRQWRGLGIAVQAYQKRAIKVIELLLQHASETGRYWQIRLVKGAYWDTEIIRAQQAGLPSYPVLTSRAATDMNYLACARLLLQKRKLVYPMFGTHNALTLACILSYARRSDDTPDAPYDFECQRLHGMGEALWQAVRRQPRFAHLPCRIYTPVGNDASALAYLIRRLLENGANSSFVHQAQDPGTPVDTLLKDPLEICKQRMFAPAERLPDPPWLHAPRKNAASFHLHNRDVQRWAGNTDAKRTDLLDKQRLQSDRLLEKTRAAGTASAPCMQTAQQALRQSAPLSVETRARQLEAWADAIETRADEALCLLVAQARKTAPDALAEIRETIDYLRYYAQQARLQLATPRQLTGPAGETNTLQLAPRGVWLCISPWNFPLAIFTGQIAAALVCGNAVLAKPAEQTSLIATWCVSLAHETGISEHRLQLLPAQRQAMPAYLQAPGLAGVSFTGSNATARQIRQTLAQRDGPQVSLIAETGGMNAMVVDSTALLEQTADHIMLSAFNMAGQRCSALRVLYVQADIAEALMVRLQGMAELIKTGSPSELDCDVPPLIDQDALARLKQQWHSLTQEGEVIVQPVFRGDASDTESADSTQTSHLPVCTPGIIRMQTPRVEQEIFGPVLQVCVFAAHEFERVLDDIASWGWGLTFGLQSRIDSRAADVSRLPVGNVYINRPMIGATVGVQPFGGQGLSGSGPKAGGPDSLGPYCTEQLVSINSAAAGGAMELLTMAADPVKLANRFDH